MNAVSLSSVENSYYIANSCEMGISDLPDTGMSAIYVASCLDLGANYQLSIWLTLWLHALRHINDDASSQAALLVDASNVFNILNRQLALANISTLCPVFSRILLNTYRNDAKLFVGGETILS